MISLKLNNPVRPVRSEIRKRPLLTIEGQIESLIKEAMDFAEKLNPGWSTREVQPAFECLALWAYHKKGFDSAKNLLKEGYSLDQATKNATGSFKPFKGCRKLILSPLNLENRAKQLTKKLRELHGFSLQKLNTPLNSTDNTSIKRKEIWVLDPEAYRRQQDWWSDFRGVGTADKPESVRVVAYQQRVSPLQPPAVYQQTSPVLRLDGELNLLGDELDLPLSPGSETDLF